MGWHSRPGPKAVRNAVGVLEAPRFLWPWSGLVLLYSLPTACGPDLEFDLGGGFKVKSQGAVLNQAKQLIQQSEVMWAAA